ncbi:MAG TPA: ABC transporter permease [Thermoanaerobaculia bacterium]|nr:ABC transporter permease [Thermoanaerobaculia bacterium]
MRRIVPFVGIILFVAAWQIAVWAVHATLVPGPFTALAAIGELARRALLVKYIIASLFRVTWGYFGAVVVGIPAGVALGLWRRGELALNPFIQILRPISPLAWIPIAILWFGVGDLSAIFLIFLASLFPLIVTAMHAVHNIEEVHVRAGANFGLSRAQLVRSVILPAILPQLVIGMRIALGIAWLVVVAAEMIAVNSGLGFLIIDARNAGNRYDLVVAGMILIGAIGIALDWLMRRAESLDFVRWGYASQ